MIVFDADVLRIDMRYSRDKRFPLNRQVLSELKKSGHPLAIVCHTLLEILGVCCFGLSVQDLLDLTDQISVTYGLSVIPDPMGDPDYAGITFLEIQDRIATKLSIGDAVTALQLEKYTPQATCFLSWNARHFLGKLKIPVLTPEEWWQKNQPAA